MKFPEPLISRLAQLPPWARPLAGVASLLLLVTLLLRCGEDATPVAHIPQGPEQATLGASPDPTATASLYLCPMHPQVIRPQPDRCPICGMDLVPKAPGRATAQGATGPKAAESAPALYVCPTHAQVKTATPDQCPICGLDLVLEEHHDHGDHGHAGPGLNRNEPGQDAAPPAGVAIQVPGAVIQKLGVRTAQVKRGDLPRPIEGVGVFLRTALQGYVSVVPGPVAEAEDLSFQGSGVILQGQIFERDALLLRVGQRVKVQVPTLGSQVWEGRVAGFDAQVIQTTRTQVFEVWVEPSAASVAPGLTALLTLEVDPVENVLLVPREAVILTGRGTRVVVALGEGRFEPRAVTVDDFGEERIVVLDGLEEGEAVVVSAQFLLDSEANVQAGMQRLSSQQVTEAAP